MPKVSSENNVHVVPPGMTLVRSRAYGLHLRASRGTHKKARLNPTLKKAAAFIAEANAAAKLLKDAIDPYRKNLVDKSLWPRLVSMFRRQQTKIGAVDFGQLNPFELHTRYTLDKLLPVQPIITYDGKARTLRIVIRHSGRANFNSRRIDGYKLSAIVLFPDMKRKTVRTEVEESGIVPVTGKAAPFDVQMFVPPRAKCFILCLRVDGYIQQKKDVSRATKGLRVVATGRLKSVASEGKSSL